MHTNTISTIRLISAALILNVICGSVNAVQAQQRRPPYDRMNLSPQQSASLRQYDDHWNEQYHRLHPQLAGEQRRLLRLLSSPKSDPLEITSTQQRVNHLRETLSGAATATYLKKRRILNNTQRQGLERWMKRLVGDKMKERQTY